MAKGKEPKAAKSKSVVAEDMRAADALVKSLTDKLDEVGGDIPRRHVEQAISKLTDAATLLFKAVREDS